MVLLDCFSSIKKMREPFPLEKNLVPVLQDKPITVSRMFIRKLTEFFFTDSRVLCCLY